jgi:predicted  nucleic acid-binding Zn-ribbon protein
LEDERDRALELASSLKDNLDSKREGGNQKDRGKKASSPKKNLENTLETLTAELEEIRLNEEQRQFNLTELSKKKKEQGGASGSEKTMVEMCKQHYGKMVSDLQQERKSLQNKVETLENELIERDMQIAELKLNIS